MLIGMLAQAMMMAVGARDSVAIMAFRPESRVRSPGDDVTSALVLGHDGRTARRVWVGYSVLDPQGTWHDAPSIPVTLAPGERTRTVTMTWHAPAEPLVIDGAYRVSMALWTAAPEQGAARRIATASRANAFVIRGGAQPFVATEAWEIATHRLGRGQMRAEQVLADGPRSRLRLLPGRCDGAELRTTARHGFGRYSARLRTPRAPGSLSALFLYADVPDGNDEIDIELLNDASGRALLTTWVAGQVTNERSVGLGFDAGAAFHDYAIDWRADTLRFLADGVVVGELHDRYPASPMKVMLNAWWPTWLDCRPPASAADLVVESVRMTDGAP